LDFVTSGALTIGRLAFSPSDKLGRMFSSLDTESQKHLVHGINVPQSGLIVRPPRNRSLGPRKIGTYCSSISLSPTVILASPNL
jgi:hypothetical protein